MPNPAHYRRLENMHRKAACNIHICPGISLTISEGRCEMTMPMRPEFFHAAKAVHGFVYFKMLDETAFFAANSYVEDVFVLTTDFQLTLLRPVGLGTLRCVGTATYQSKSRLLAESVLYTEDGKQVARGTGSFVRGPTLLNADIGYAD